MKKGYDFEKSFSELAHSENVAVLVSSNLLRSLNLGQIDVACLKKEQGRNKLFLYECKSTLFPKRVQWVRLLRTQDYLSRLLAIETKLEVKFCQKDQPSLFF